MKSIFKKVINLCLCAAFVLLYLPSSCQEFKASLAGGFNASQLDGDNLLGFNKLGLHAGLRIEWSKEKSGWAAEMLFQQKGSTESLSFGTPDEILSITLNYLSVPVLFYFNEWYDEEIGAHKFRIDAGLMTNALFKVKSTNPFFDDATDDFKNFDFGIVAGLSYRLSRKTSVAFRYERSFLEIYQDPIANTTGLQSYLLNFRLEYHLNPND